MKNLIKKIIGISFLAGIFVLGVGVSQSAVQDSIFSQASWSGGPDGGSEAIQSDWTKYSEIIGSAMDTGAQQLKLQSNSGTFSDTSEGDFSSGAYDTNAMVVSGGDVKLTLGLISGELYNNLNGILVGAKINAQVKAGDEIYIGADNGKFLKYNILTDAATDLTSRISSFWGGNKVICLAVDSGNNVIYLGGVGGKFAKYEIIPGTSTDLSSKISSFWVYNWNPQDVYCFAFNANNNAIYLGGSNGKFAKYFVSTSSAVDLSSTISSFWNSQSINCFAVDSNSDFIYLGGESGKFARLATATDIATDLRNPEQFSLLGADAVQCLAFDSLNNAIYLAVGAKKFARYNADNTVDDLSSKITGGMYYNNFKSMEFDSLRQIMYIAWAGSNRDHSYSRLSRYNTPSYNAAESTYNAPDTGYDLTSRIPSYWNDDWHNLLSLVLDTTNNVVYLGGMGGNFSRYNTGLYEYSGQSPDLYPNKDTSYDLSTKTNGIGWNNAQINAMALAGNNVYIGGDSGKLAKYNIQTYAVTGLESKISSFWSTNKIYCLVFNQNNNILYLGGENGAFAKLDTMDTATNLRSPDKLSFWGSHIYSFALDADNNILYLLGGNGYFAKFTTTTPESAANLSNKISFFWETTYANPADLAFDPDRNMVYLSEQYPSRFGVYDVVNDYATNLRDPNNDGNEADSKLTWSASTLIYSLLYANNAVYIGGEGGRFAKYDISLPSPITSYYTPWSYNVLSLVFDSAQNIVYLGGDSNSFAVYNIQTQGFTQLSSLISSAWSGNAVNALVFDPTNEEVYLGGAGGRFSKYGPSTGYSSAFTSRIFDTDAYPQWGTMTWTEDKPANTSITLKVRTSDNADMSGATDWSSCSAVTKGYDITGSGLASDGHRYIQYQAVLATTDALVTPTLSDVTINYTGFPRTAQELVSSAYDTGSSDNLISVLGWTETLFAGNDVQLQLRTAPTQGGLTGDWYGPSGLNSYYTDPLGSEAIYSSHRDGSNDQWVQYKVRLSTTGSSTPTFDDFKLYYGAPSISNVTLSAYSYRYDGTSKIPITWDTTGLTASNNVTLKYSINNGADYPYIIAENISATTGSYSDWIIPDVHSSQVKVQVSNADYNKSATTSSLCTILPQLKNISGANGTVGIAQNVSWQTLGTVARVLLECSRDNGATWMDMQGNTGQSTNIVNSIPYSWTPPLPGAYLVKVSDESDPMNVTVTSASFTISNGALSETNVEPQYLYLNRVGTVTVNFTTHGVIPTGGKIKVTFPTGFSFNSGGATGATSTTMDGTLSVSVSGQIITLTRSGGSQQPAGDEVITLTNIKTPGDGNPGGYKIETQDSSGTVIEKDDNVSGDIFAGFIFGVPASGTVWAAGSADKSITWTPVGAVTNKLWIEYFDGTEWQTVKDGTLEAMYDNKISPQLWDIPAGARISSLYQIRITDAGADRDWNTTGDNIVCLSDAFSVSGGIGLSAPLGGQKWAIGASHNIVWTKNGSFDTKIQYSTNSGTSWSALTGGGADNQGIDGTSLAWTPSVDLSAGSTAMRIKVSDASTSNPPASSSSASDFTVCSLKIGALSGSGMTGGRAKVGGSVTIPWAAVGVDYVKLEYYSNTNGSYQPIPGASALAAGGNSFAWTVPDDVGAGVSIRATAVDASGVQDLAIEGLVQDVSATFAIYGILTLVSPNGGESSASTSPLTITFSGSASIDNIKFYYKLIPTGIWAEIISSVSYTYSNGSGSGIWTPGFSDGSLWMKIEDANDSAVYDESNNYFTLSGVGLNSTVTANSPYTVGGQAALISGTAVVSGNVKLEYSTTGVGGQYVTLGAGADNVSVSNEAYTYNWVIPDAISSNVYIKVSDKSSSSFATAGPITIRAGFSNVAVSPPQNGSYYKVGEQVTISWNTAGTVNNVKLEYYTGIYNAATAPDIASSAANTGSYSWVVPDDIRAGVKIRVSDADAGHPEASADSAAFNIKGALAIYTPPQDGWRVHKGADIAWQVTGNIGDVKIQYQTSKDDGATDPYSNWVDAITTPSGWAAGIGVGGQEYSYASYIVPDVVASEVGQANVQSDPDVYMRLKISDADDANVYAVSNGFVVRYHKITWNITDISGSPLTGLNAQEEAVGIPNKPAWIVDDGSFGGLLNRDHYYPDNSDINSDAYTTMFYRVEAGKTYTKSIGSWRADSDETLTYVMDTAASAEIEYSVNIQADYDIASDAISIAAWLTKDGLLVERADPVNDLTAISVNVYDSSGTQLNAADLGSGISASAQGVFSGISYDSLTGLDPAASYTIKAVVTHTGASYTGAAVFIVPSQFNYSVKISTLYNSLTDSLAANVWLDRSGTTVMDPGDLTFIVYDAGGNVVDTLSFDGYDTADDTDFDAKLKSGVYSGVEWDPDNGITANTMYSVKAQISYGGKTYDALVSFQKGLEAQIAEGVTDLQSSVSDLGTEVGNVSTQVATVSAQVGTVGTQVGEIGAEVSGVGAKISDMTAQVSGMTSNIASVLTATGTEPLSDRITAAQKEIADAVKAGVEPYVKSGILTRENVVTSGDTITIRYRTITGLSVKMDVYNPTNTLLVNKAPMAEVGVTGVYEHSLNFPASWGTGDFTVVCSESTQGTVDALIITVTSHSVDEVAGETAALLSATSGLSGVREIVDNLNTQFGTIDKTLTALSQKIAGKMEQAKGVVSDLETVYNQLVVISAQVKKLGAAEGVDLDKLYEVSMDKKEDIVYLKNKAQELKAAMELNQKIMENAGKKPVVQSWFEFK